MKNKRNDRKIYIKKRIRQKNLKKIYIYIIKKYKNIENKNKSKK